jgi:hypothetical protein
VDDFVVGFGVGAMDGYGEEGTMEGLFTGLKTTVVGLIVG